MSRQRPLTGAAPTADALAAGRVNVHPRTFAPAMVVPLVLKEG